MRATEQAVLTLAVVAMATVSAHGQFYKLHGASVSVGGTEFFSTPITSSPTGGVYTVTNHDGGTLQETVSGQQQFTSNAFGGVASMQFHPVAFAGVEMNYAASKYSERYFYNYSSAAGQITNVTTWSHEATAAYVFHPKHIKFQPFVNIGGGAIDFLPSRPQADNQWRGAGLLETGFDIPTKSPHLAIRIEGRALFYRAPNFDNPALSTRTWRSTEEPTAAFVYRF